MLFMPWARSGLVQAKNPRHEETCRGYLSSALLFGGARMVPVRYAVVLMAVLFLAPSASAQQGRQRRVLTNEDVASSAPSTPAAEPAVEPAAKPAPAEPAAEKAPSAEAAPADAATSDAASAEEQPPAAPPGPKERIQRLTEIQGAFQKAIEEFSARAGRESDMTQRMRWENLALCLNAAMQASQQLITELQSEVQAQEPSPQPPAPSAPSPQ